MIPLPSGQSAAKITVDSENPDKHWSVFQCKTTGHNIIQEFELPTLSVMSGKNDPCVNMINWQDIIGFIDNNSNCNLFFVFQVTGIHADLLEYMEHRLMKDTIQRIYLIYSPVDTSF